MNDDFIYYGLGMMMWYEWSFVLFVIFIIMRGCDVNQRNCPGQLCLEMDNLWK